MQRKVYDRRTEPKGVKLRLARSFVRAGVLLATVAACLGAGESRGSVTRGIAYAADANPKHRLDLYLPSTSDAPLVVFVHGGAFMGGDRRGFALLGLALAAQGYAVAIPSYRLYPETDAQGGTQDIARALAWLSKNGLGAHVDASRIILAGHSAGGQIVAMLATHHRYLDAAGVAPHAVRGAIVLAGAYDVRDLSDEPLEWQRLDALIYGPSVNDRANISPGIDIDAQTPPILAVCGTRDDPGACPRARFFVNTLHTAGHAATFVQAEGADHNELVTRFIDRNDALNRAFRRLVAEGIAAQNDR